MIDCDDLIEDLHRLASEQVDLATFAAAPLVADMHIDLALFGVEQARVVEAICDDG